MSIITEVFCFIVIISQVISQGPPTSVCPGIFQYEFDGTRWIGVVNISNPPPYGTEMLMVIKMAVRSRIPQDDVGKIELYDDLNEVVQKIYKGESIKYKVRFPNVSVVPQILRITFAGKVICEGPDLVGGFITLIDLQHKINSGESALINSPKDSIVYVPLQPIVPELENTNDNVGPIVRNDSEVLPNTSLNDICGTIALTNRIFFGDDTSKGDWPWLVAMFSKKSASLEFKCAGTLISDKYVITAAHCVTIQKSETLKAANIILRLGVYSLYSWTEESSLTRTVKRVKVYPSYSANDLYSNDIAMLEMEVPVSYTTFIRPICLWNGNSDINNIVGQNGYVVGWGKNEMGLITTPEPKMSTVPIVSQSVCRSSKNDFLSLTSDKTLCAGNRDGTGPCNGDSGGGLYMQQGYRWTLRGIVSISLKDSETGSCNLNEYIVYTDVSKYSSWIMGGDFSMSNAPQPTGGGSQMPTRRRPTQMGLPRRQQ